MTNLASGTQFPEKFPTHLLGPEQAGARLQPFTRPIAECIRRAWDDYIKEYAHVRHKHSARTRATIIFDHIIDEAIAKFSGMVGATLKKQNGIYLLYIGDDLVLRFKKIGKDGRCHNIPTRQQNRFEAQRNLPSMEKGTMLHAGYMLDELGQRIVAIRIVCQFARQVIWQIDLSEGGTENVVAMPSQPSMPIKPKSPRFERDTKETPAEPKVENSGKE